MKLTELFLPRSAICLACLSLLVTTIAGCTGGSTPTDVEKQGLTVVATSGPVGDAVVNVLGDYGTVDVLMGPGIDPHLYKEKPSDLRTLSDADVVFYNGLHFEGIHDTLHKLGEKRPVFALAHELEHTKDARLRFPEGIEALPDPHVWHDASIWADCVGELAEQLSKVDSEHASAYQAAAEAYQAELTRLHTWCSDQIATIPESQRMMVTAHDAFGYFSDAYGIRTVALKGVSTEDEVDLGQMQSVIDLVVERKVPAVFVESSVAPTIIEALVEPCRARGHDVKIGGELFADALGDAESGADTYLRMMRANVRTIVEALGGEFTPFPDAEAPAEQ